MKTLSRKMLSILLSVLLLLGTFSVILPTAKLILDAKAEGSAPKSYDYMEVLDGVDNDASILDTRALDVANTTFGTDGLKPLGIWNAMGLDAAYGALGISHNFFSGTAVGAERNEIHPYIVYNVTPGTSFKLSSAVHKDSNENESVLSFYVSNDGVTWIPVDAERNSEGVWKSKKETYSSYTSYVYTIDNVGLKTNFVKAEYPMTMASKDDGREPSAYLLVYGVEFVTVEDYAVNDETLFEAMAFARQKELYEEHFIAYPDFVNVDSSVSTVTSAATSNYGMLQNSTWGDFSNMKDRSYVAMVAPGSHFYLETANNWFMPELGSVLGSAEQARIRVYSSATLSDDAQWTEWAPMPYSCGGAHTPTFNFYLPKDHIYVRIVYPQQGRVGSVEGFQYTDVNGNDAAFFNDMVFTPYVKAEADSSYDYTTSAYWSNPQEGTSNLSQDTSKSLGITIPWTNGKNLANDAAQNTDSPYAKGHFSIQYAVEGGKMFNLEYAVRFGNYGGNKDDGNTKGNYEANVNDGSSMELIIETSTDKSTWTNAYETESGYAQTTNKTGNDCYVFDVNYLVPADAKYVRVSFGLTGVGYLADNSTYQGFNDCIYIRKVSVADANNVFVAPSTSTTTEFVYTTDTDTNQATSTSNVVNNQINDDNRTEGNTAFGGDWGYLDQGNLMTAGTKERGYVIYDVIPGSTLNFDFSMRQQAIAMAEASANFNLQAGLGRADLTEFEFFVYGRADESSSWTYIGKTDSNSLTPGDANNNYDTFGFGSLGVTVPAGFRQVKIEFPQTGGYVSNGATVKTYDYTSDFYAGGDWSGPVIGAWNYSHIGIVGASSDQVCYESVVSGLTSTWNQDAWGAKDFYLIYKVKPGSTFVADVKLPALSTRQTWASQGTTFEFTVSSSATIDGTYGDAVTTEGKEADAVIGYQVPTGCEYVKITFPNKGTHPITGEAENHSAYIKAVSFYDSGAGFAAGNDAAYLYNVTYATGVKEVAAEYIYSTDTDASKATSTSNADVGSLNGATGFMGGYGHLVAGDSQNVKTLAGTRERPYVIYDVIPGSAFSFDYTMRATAKAASETTAALNVRGGLGNETLKEYEFFVYGRADESSAWKYIGKTDSNALSYAAGADTSSYDTFGLGNGSFTIPAGITQVKVELPNTGAFTTATPTVWDYSTKNDNYGMWNNGEIGANYITFNDADGEENDNIIGGGDSDGIRPTYGSLSSAWGTKEFYIIYQVKAGTTFVANFEMHDSATREGYAAKTGEPFEAKLQYSADKASWSEAVTTAGQGTNAVLACTVPGGYQYVKITFPQKGTITGTDYRGNDAATLTGVTFYTNAWITAGNDATCLYNVTYATGVKAVEGVVDYTALDSANITSSDKKYLSIYHHGGVSVVEDEGVKANSENAFVIYKIKEDSILTLNSNDELSFEYSVDDSVYKPFKAVKTCKGYEIPAIAGRNYIKVKLDNGEAITSADAKALAPTAKFYIPYLNKYELVDYADYGVASNSVSPEAIEPLRPGYTFAGWDRYDDGEEVYIDTVYEATFTKAEKYKYTVSWTADGEAVNQNTYYVDDRVTITAPAVNSEGKKFSKWVDAKGVTVANSTTFSFLVSGNITIKAVYADEKEAMGAFLYATEDPIITSNDNGTWNMSVVWRTAVPEGIEVKETGILFAVNADKPNLVLWDGATQSGTVKMKHNNTSENKTAMYTVKNIASGAVRTALPYAILSNGDVIYGENVIKVKGGVKVASAFEFKDGITPTVLNNYLDRAITYDAFGTAEGQTRDSAIYNAKDLLRQTNAKYLARGLGFWIPTSTDIYGENFTNYKNWIAEIHEMDPEVIVEACIFETCSSETNDLVIPDWVQEKFGQTVQTGRTFNVNNMKHDWRKMGIGAYYGVDEWGEGIHIPSISQVETQMFIYYRACTLIDMGVEAIHFGQMYRIGATATNISGDVSSIDYASWTKVLDAISEYAKTHARRGYVLVNGHNEDQKLVRSDDSGKMLVDFNAYPLRITANATSNTTPASGFQNVKLDTSSNAPYNKIVTGMKTPSGDTVEGCYPYLLEFDNFGIDSSNKDKISCDDYYVWGYDEISWYANQNATDRRAYLTTIAEEVAGLSAANGHVCMPGKRTAYISETGCSEYIGTEYYNMFYDSSTGCAVIPVWDIHIAGDLDAVKAAWTAIGSYNATAE